MFVGWSVHGRRIDDLDTGAPTWLAKGWEVVT